MKLISFSCMVLSWFLSGVGGGVDVAPLYLSMSSGLCSEVYINGVTRPVRPPGTQGRSQCQEHIWWSRPSAYDHWSGPTTVTKYTSSQTNWHHVLWRAHCLFSQLDIQLSPFFNMSSVPLRIYIYVYIHPSPNHCFYSINVIYLYLCTINQYFISHFIMMYIQLIT